MTTNILIPFLACCITGGILICFWYFLILSILDIDDKYRAKKLNEIKKEAGQ